MVLLMTCHGVSTGDGRVSGVPCSETEPLTTGDWIFPAFRASGKARRFTPERLGDEIAVGSDVGRGDRRHLEASPLSYIGV